MIICERLLLASEITENCNYIEEMFKPFFVHVKNNFLKKFLQLVIMYLMYLFSICGNLLTNGWCNDNREDARKENEAGKISLSLQVVWLFRTYALSS